MEAARAGNLAMCRWLLEKGDELALPAFCCAARNGHTALAEWMLQQWHVRARPWERDRATTHELEAMAEGCDLPTLQRLHRVWGRAAGDEDHGLPLRVPREDSLLQAACRGSTADWQAKVEWLEAQGSSRRSATAWAGAAVHPDAAARFAWLRQRGYPLNREAVEAAARTCDATALLLLRDWGVQLTGLGEAAMAAVIRSGDLATLQLLHASGCGIGPQECSLAARAGQRHVLEWLVETLGCDPQNTPDLLEAAADSGDLQLMAWLHERGWLISEAVRTVVEAGPWRDGREGAAALAWLRERGCPWGELTFTLVTAGGSEEALEWLAEQGCPMGTDGAPYQRAAVSSDLATLHCLLRLGCPWDPTGETFTAALSSGARLPALAWLLREGCPVNWERAQRAAACYPQATDVKKWVAAQRRLAEGPDAQQA